MEQNRIEYNMIGLGWVEQNRIQYDRIRIRMDGIE